MTKNILLVGVGGQGTILTSKILSQGLLEAGFDVKMAEIHGMSQRGGSVTTQIRYGDAVYSPLVEKGGADIIVSFERSEALRWLEYLKEDGILILNEHQIQPFTVTLDLSEYPENLVEEYKTNVKNFKSYNAFEMAKKLGNSRVMNIVLLGSLVKYLGLEDINWKNVIKETVPEKFVDLNIQAFEKGYSI
ncbi:MAG: indolepyruvate oxidoreductase subunit beta [Eubacteriales bacterium]